MLNHRVSGYVKSSFGSFRLLSSTVSLKTQNNMKNLGSEKQYEIVSPVELAQDSQLPGSTQESESTLRKIKTKLPLKSESKIEMDPNFQMSPFLQSIGQWVIRIFSIDMDKSRAGPVAGSHYFAECKKQGLFYPNEPLSPTARFYYETLRLPMTFSQQFQISVLHYWILSVRMRALPYKYGQNYKQKLVDRLFTDLENRMSHELGINSNSIIQKYLKDYHTQLLGSVLSYDEGLVTDDITLANALWRNIFNAEESADIRHVEALLGYVRSQLYVLNHISDREFGFGKFRFVPPDQVVKRLTKAQEERHKEQVRAEFEKHNLPSQRSVLSLDE